MPRMWMNAKEYHGLYVDDLSHGSENRRPLMYIAAYEMDVKSYADNLYEGLICFKY